MRATHNTNKNEEVQNIMRLGKSVLAASLLSVPLLANGQTCLPVEQQTILDFHGSSVSENNLEVDEVGQMRFDQIGSFRQGDVITPIDLVVKRIPGKDYDVFNTNQNRINGYYGSINVLTENGEGFFDFCFEETATGNPVTLDHFFFSFYDLDSHNADKGFEQLTMKKSDFIEYYLTDTTQIETEETNQKVKFVATEHGVAVRNIVFVGVNKFLLHAQSANTDPVPDFLFRRTTL